jgi:hypothetical protein
VNLLGIQTIGRLCYFNNPALYAYRLLARKTSGSNENKVLLRISQRKICVNIVDLSDFTRYSY